MALLPFGSPPSPWKPTTGGIYYPNEVGINTSTLKSQLTIKNNTVNDNAVIGSTNLVTVTDFTQAADWTTVNWTVTSTTATHNTGHGQALVASLANITPVVGQSYVISFQVTGMGTNTTDTIKVTFGGKTSPTMLGTSVTLATNPFVFVMTATNATGKLTFIPTLNWPGIISNVTVNQITFSTPSYTTLDSTGATTFELRGPIATANSFFMGTNAGKANAASGGNPGANNVGIGTNAFLNNTTGFQGIAIGANALQANTVGQQNIAIGQNSMFANTIGFGNTAIGPSAMIANQSGSTNISIGPASMQGSTLGSSNVAIGYSALSNNTTGNFNGGIGYQAGAGVNNPSITGSYNLFLGPITGFTSTTASYNNSTAIGALATVNASNSLILGAISGINTASSDTFVGVRTTTPIANFHNAGGMALNRTTVADAAYSILTTDYIVALTSITAARTFTLPTAIGVAGQLYVIKDESGSVTATNTLTIATTSAQTIDGSTTAVIKVAYTSLTLYSNGANWNVI